jgi:hypothetical protein
MEVKIVSSARPLQIQRSFEGSPSVESNSSPSTAPSSRKSEFYNEEIHSRTRVSVQRPLTPAEFLKVIDYFRVFVFTLFVLAATMFCIVTEDDISLAYVLTVIAILSLIAFHFLKI